jgi:hypothetical protein
MLGTGDKRFYLDGRPFGGLVLCCCLESFAPYALPAKNAFDQH